MDTNKPKIIAFGHRKRVGKDTSGNFLTSILRLSGKYKSIRKVGFADKVKDIAYQLFYWTGLQAADFYNKPENAHLRETVLPIVNKTPRQLWIGVGNGVRAHTCDDIWAQYLFNATTAQVVIVTDLRFPAEAESIKVAGGAVIKINRPGTEIVVDGADDRLAEYTGWDDVIENDEDLKSLYKKIELIAGKYLLGGV